jgi:hypothetical protein
MQPRGRENRRNGQARGVDPLAQMRPSDITAPIPVLHLSLPRVMKSPPAPGFVYWRDDVPVGAVKASMRDVADCTPLRETIAPLSGEPRLPALYAPDRLINSPASFAQSQTLAPRCLSTPLVDDRPERRSRGVRYVRVDKPGLTSR